MKFLARLLGVPNLERPVKVLCQHRETAEKWGRVTLRTYAGWQEEGGLSGGGLSGPIYPEARVALFEIVERQVGEIRPRYERPAVETTKVVTK